MPFIKKYLKLTAQEKLDLWEYIIIHNFLKEPLFPEEESLFRKLKRIIKNLMPWNIAKEKWYNAFLFFYNLEKEEIGKIHLRMGLPKNGIRPDEC